MGTHNNEAQQLLNLENVQLVIKGPPEHRVLNKHGRDSGDYGHPTNRKWRTLRSQLCKLFDTEQIDKGKIAQWLNDAGYLARSSAQNVPFTENLVTRDILYRVFEWGFITNWAMSTIDPISAPRFRRRLGKYLQNMRKALKNQFAAPDSEGLFEDLDNAPSLDIHLWEMFLMGFGAEHPRPANLSLGPSARPVLEIAAESPIHAIMLTVFMDRVFTKKTFSRCKWCHRRFPARNENQMFCSAPEYGTRHQSLWKTKFRREKVKAVKQATQKAGQNWTRVARIASEIVHKKYPQEPVDKVKIAPEWAKAEFMKGAKKR
jgi:hypothetical protein